MASHVFKFLLCGAIASFCVVQPAAAAPEPAKTPVRATAAIGKQPSLIEVTYAFYAGGVRVAKADATAQLDAKRYNANAIVRTEGSLGRMFNIVFSFQAVGQRDAGRFTPETFAAVYTGFKGDPTMTVSFSREDQQPTNVKPALRRGLKMQDFQSKPPLVDPMSALLEAAISSNKAPCNRTFDLFDGVRSYRITLGKPQKDDVGSYDGSVYNGPAVQCRWTYKLVKASRDDWAHRMLQDAPPEGKIWFADLKGVMAPVRLMAETPVVAVMMHVMAASVNGEDVATVKAKANTPTPATKAKPAKSSKPKP